MGNQQRSAQKSRNYCCDFHCREQSESLQGDLLSTATDEVKCQIQKQLQLLKVLDWKLFPRSPAPRTKPILMITCDYKLALVMVGIMAYSWNRKHNATHELDVASMGTASGIIQVWGSRSCKATFPLKMGWVMWLIRGKRNSNSRWFRDRMDALKADQFSVQYYGADRGNYLWNDNASS